jgi:hypothetical protein
MYKKKIQTRAKRSEFPREIQTLNAQKRAKKKKKTKKVNFGELLIYKK